MTSRAKKILFITPGAQSFGGNILLLNFLRWYKQNGGREFMTLYGHPGDLDDDFAALSPTYRYYTSEDSPTFSRKAAGKLANKMELRRAFLKSQIKRENLGLIYSNAVTNGRMLSMFDSLDVPVISHCHELESLIQLSGLIEFNGLKERTTHFVAVSDAVRRNLVENHSVPNNEITVQYGFIPIPEFSQEEVTARRHTVLNELKLPDEAFIVGASGTLNWRKAPELFVQIAGAVKRRMPDAPIHFVWIGGASESSPEVFRLHYDASRLGLSRHLHFIEHTPEPLAYFTGLDAFAMVSREDPYPLVCLEAASLGKPIICFADAGGIPEFVEDDCGFVVPYLDIDAFAAAILELYSDPEKRKSFGDNASRKVRARHDIEVAAPHVVEIIERFYRL